VINRNKTTFSLVKKKLADFGTLNNITTSAFTFLINLTKKFLATYYDSCKISLVFNFLVASYFSRTFIEEGSFGVRAGANFGQFFLR
jgi:hypothetical protein